VKVGDLVRLKDGTHEDGIPDHRTAIIVSSSAVPGSDYVRASEEYDLMFLGSEKTYRFNGYFIVPIQKVD